MASKPTLSAALEAQHIKAAFSGARPQTENPRFLEHDVSGNCSEPVPRVLYGQESKEIIWKDGVSSIRTHPALETLRWVRCRKCKNCMTYAAQHWAGRCVREIAASPRTWFVTLTYTEEEHLRRQWLIEDDRERHQSYVKDVQDMFKRIRKNHAVRYIAVPEPHESGLLHWHLLIHEAVSGSLTNRYISGNQKEGSTSRMWPHGIVHCRLTGADVSDQRRAWYVCKYIRKMRVGRVQASQKYGRA